MLYTSLRSHALDVKTLALCIVLSVYQSNSWRESIVQTPIDLWEPESDGWKKQPTLIAADVWAYGTLMWEVSYE